MCRSSQGGEVYLAGDGFLADLLKQEHAATASEQNPHPLEACTLQDATASVCKHNANITSRQEHQPMKM